MKIDKEYPATHSMSTAWYAVDVDGNVALVQYNDNGPVPEGCDETNLEALVYEHSIIQDNGIPTLSYTEEQIVELIDGCKEGDPEVIDPGIYLVQPNLIESFIRDVMPLVKAEESDFLSRLSSSSNAFYIYSCGTQLEYTLRCMAKQGYFVKYYYCSYDINDSCQSGNFVNWDKNFKSLPFYVFGQPYWPDFLLDKVHTPVNPVRLEQLSPKIQSEVTRIPFRFSDIDHFQIALYTPFKMHSDGYSEIYKGRQYEKLPVDNNGKMKYICRSGDYTQEEKVVNTKVIKKHIK